MKKVNVTFSISPEIHKALQRFVDRKKMSSFVNNAISKALEMQKLSLKKEYLRAAEDPGENEAIEDWSSLEVDSTLSSRLPGSSIRFKISYDGSKTISEL